MTRAVICDNNILFADWLRDQLKTLLPAPHAISVCYTPDDLRKECQKEPPQIALLDIHLGDSPENGITLAQELFPINSGVSVIFITGYSDYLPDVYEANHIYCLRKPVNLVYLKRAVQKALDTIPPAVTVFPIQTNKAIQIVDMRDVLSIESFYRKLHLRMWNETVECYGSISSLPEFVLKHMIQCHKSFLVNPDYIRTMDHQKFLLKDGTSVPISRSRFVESRQAFLAYCVNHLEV